MAAERACTRCGKLKPLTKNYWYVRDDGTFRAQCRTCELAVRRQREADAKPEAQFPEPLQLDELKPEDRKLLSPGMFPAFFGRFSGLGALPDHGSEWVEIVEDNDNLILNVPSGHAKTTIFEWYCIWKWAQNRQYQILWLSKSQPIANRSARSISQILEFHEDLNRAYGKFRNDDVSWPWRPESGELMVAGRDRQSGTGDLSLQARGSRQHILGIRADLVIADDVTDRRLAQSETESIREEEWFRGDAMSRLNTVTSKVAVIGQRVHPNDLYARLLNPEDITEDVQWKHEVRPAVLQWPTDDQPAIVLWPQNRPWTFLKKQRTRLGSGLFNAYYQQAPEAEGGGVRPEWIEACLDRDRAVGVGRERQESERKVRAIAVDPSPNHFAGIITADITAADGDFRYDVLDVRRPFDIGTDGLLGMLANLQTKYKADVLVIEVNSLKMIMRDQTWEKIRKLFGNQVIAHNTTATNKNHETLGYWAMRGLWEFGRIRLPYGTPEAEEHTKLLAQEALGQVPTTDCLMAMWFLFHNAQKLQYYGTVNFPRAAEGGWKIPPRLMKGTATGQKPVWPWMKKRAVNG